MYSKSLELAGLALIAWGVGLLLGTAAGMICGGLSLLFIGGVTDDAAVGAIIRRAGHHVVFVVRRQQLKETLLAEQRSPQPPIQVDADVQALADELVKQRQRRGDGRITEAYP
jgi:hypothetical protein